MGLFGTIKLARRLQQGQSFSYGGFPYRQPKTDIEKFINSKKEAYPNSWKYWVNRLTIGVQRVSVQCKNNELTLTQDQEAFLHDFCEKYYDSNKDKLIIPGHKNMDVFKRLTELIPDLDTFKLLYGKKGSWANYLATVSLITPINGAHWNPKKGFLEKYELPLLLNYNVKGKIIHQKPKLITLENHNESTKLQKVFVRIENKPQEKSWLFANTYCAWLPILTSKKGKTVFIVNGNTTKEVSFSKFYQIKKTSA